MIIVDRLLVFFEKCSIFVCYLGSIDEARKSVMNSCSFCMTLKKIPLQLTPKLKRL